MSGTLEPSFVPDEFDKAELDQIVRIGSVVTILDLHTEGDYTFAVTNSEKFRHKINHFPSSHPISKAVLGASIGTNLEINFFDGSHVCVVTSISPLADIQLVCKVEEPKMNSYLLDFQN